MSVRRCVLCLVECQPAGWAGSILFTGVSDAAVLRLTTEADSTCFLQVFDDKNQFAEWFGDSFGKTAPGAGGEDDVAMEKRVVVIHRLHQILEPFMLRRQVQDVEGKLPPKVPPHSDIGLYLLLQAGTQSLYMNALGPLEIMKSLREPSSCIALCHLSRCNRYQLHSPRALALTYTNIWSLTTCNAAALSAI